ncbi:MAG: DUF4271 domain-containing protein [Chitinophagaceae bacterium]|nr:DUF4271 domain-containing protein [Chitinophagaceae bacterium]
MAQSAPSGIVPAMSNIGQAYKNDIQLLQGHPMLEKNQKGPVVKALPRKSENKSGVFFIAMAFLFAFAGIKQAYPKYFSNLYDLFTSFNISKRQIREQLENDKVASWWFYMFYFITLAFLAYLIAGRYTPLTDSRSPFLFFFICLCIIVVFSLLKIILLKLISWVFQKKEIVEQYLFNSAITNEFSGVMLFPLCIILLLVRQNLQVYFLFMAIGIGMIMLIFKYLRIYKGINNLLRIDFIHFLLYLCAFEIMPVLVFLKLVR